MLQQLPVTVLPFSLPPKIKRLVKDSPSQFTAIALIEKWSKNSLNSQLQTAAILALRK
jgi:hypothetical protein